MKYLKLLYFFVLMSFGSAFSSTSEYQTIVAHFSNVSVETVLNKIANSDKFILYLGRETCPFCVDFVPILDKVSTSEKKEIFYLDTEKGTDDYESVEEFRKKYKINYVPSLIIFNHEDVRYLEFPSTEGQLLEFIKILE